MQKILFITNVEHLKISSNLGRGEKVGDKFFITNDRPFIEKLLTSAFYNAAGCLETDYLKTANAVAYSIEDCKPFSDNKAAVSFLTQRLAHVRLFLQMLWLVKDNSANIDLGYLEHPYKDFRSKVSRQSFALYYSTARGEVIPTEFSREELRRTREIFRSFEGEIVLESQFATEERIGRFERAFYFLQAARSSADLGVKIANYCTCLEALFSNDAQELSHKLSERVACFLESELSARSSIFQLVKKAYSIRSKVVHGVRGSQKLRDAIIEAAVSCDNILRRIFLTILENSSLRERFFGVSKEENDEEYFLSLVLTPIARNKEQK